MKVIGKVLFGVFLFLFLWTVEASAAWVSTPYCPYPYAVQRVYTTVTVAAPPYAYAYYGAPAAVYVPAVPAVTYVRPSYYYAPRPVVYAPPAPVYYYPQVGWPVVY